MSQFVCPKHTLMPCWIAVHMQQGFCTSTHENNADNEAALE